MAKGLTKQESKFVEIKAKTGNGTLAVQEAFQIEDPNYAGVKANRLLRKDKIKSAIEEELPDDLLLEVHREGLRADYKGLPDYSVRHKYLDSAYKLRGDYAAEKHVTLNLDANSSDRTRELGNRLVGLFRRRD